MRKNFFNARAAIQTIRSVHRPSNPIFFIVGEMRCFGHNRAAIEDLVSGRPHVVVTGAADLSTARKWFPNALEVTADDVFHDGHLARLTRAWPEGDKARQWLKLRYAIEAAEQVEQGVGSKFSHFVKLRTDLVECDKRVFGRLSRSSVMMQSDLVFSAPRKHWGVMKDFFLKIPHYTNNSRASQVNFWSTLRSDLTAGRISRMKFTRATMLRNWRLVSRVYCFAKVLFPALVIRLERKLALLIAAVRSPAQTAFDEVLLKDWNKDGAIAFPSEPAFLEHLLNNGVVVGRFPSPHRFVLCRDRSSPTHRQHV